MNQEQTYEEIIEFAKRNPVIDTHCHHHKDEEFRDFNLKRLINETYVAWVDPIPECVEVPPREWFERLRCNNAFYWLERGIQETHGAELRLNRDDFPALSAIVEEAYRDPEFHLQSMRRCGYEKVLLECYWDPGSDNGHPDLFAPMFRVNTFFYGYSKESRCHNGFNPLERFQMGVPSEIDEYCQKVFEVLQAAKSKGMIALKSAIPYDRGLNLYDCEKSRANAAFLRCMSGRAEPSDVESFQGYMLNRLCEMSVRLDLPFQMHTGLGKMINSNAMWLQPTIENHPETQFVLLHGSFPWCSDMLGLAHHYRNVYPDIAWMPVLSTAVAERFLDDLLEVARADGICWGCDTWTPEESRGALAAAREVIARVLSKKVAAGRIGKDDALRIARMIFFENADRLYFKRGNQR